MSDIKDTQSAADSAPAADFATQSVSTVQVNHASGVGAASDAAVERTTLSLLRELALPVTLIAIVAYFGSQLFTMQVPDGVAFPGPRFFPAVIICAISALTIAQIVLSVAHWRSGRVDRERLEASSTHSTRFSPVAFAWVVGGFTVFCLLLQFLGWILAAALLFWCSAMAFDRKHPLKHGVVALAFSSCTYIAFAMLLDLSLPSGLLGGAW